MRNILKATLIFGAAYFLLQLPGTWLVFAWRSFGGGAHLNFLQHVLDVFIRFPASALGWGVDFPLMAMLTNTLFWSLSFAALLLLIRLFRGRRQ